MSEAASYRHTPEMGEISGFGGGYEALCQDMLDAGVKWLVATRAQRGGEEIKLKAKVYENVTGILIPANDDAKALETAVMAADTDKQATGAMHHAVMGRLMWIAHHGWDAYCAELAKHEAEDGT